MPAGREEQIEHLLRRAGFGATQEEVDTFADLGFALALEVLLDYERIPVVVDANISSLATSASRARFNPVSHARQATWSRYARPGSTIISSAANATLRGRIVVQ